MAVPVLSEQDRWKQDRSDDALFYAEPRFVHHLDGAFRARLTALYRERIPAGAVVLDLMSSWVSHLPEDLPTKEVIGHGLNARELEANPRLDRHWLQNLNLDQRLPLETGSVDAVLIVAGWQYLQQPEAVAAELLRVVRPRGEVIVAFSNRMFFSEGAPDLDRRQRPGPPGLRGGGAHCPRLALAAAGNRRDSGPWAAGLGRRQRGSLLCGDRHETLTLPADGPHKKARAG